MAYTLRVKYFKLSIVYFKEIILARRNVVDAGAESGKSSTSRRHVQLGEHKKKKKK
jgi:hypothetical protein